MQMQRRSGMSRSAGNGTYSLWNKYYSVVRFQSTQSGSGPYTYTVNAGTQLRAFSYVVGQDMGSVGFPNGSTPATIADTNLQKPGETISGETVKIYGIAAQLTSDSEPALAKAAWPNISVQLSLNGDNILFKLGTLEFIPGAGGLCGYGDSLLTTPSVTESVARAGVVNNGMAQVGNFFPFPEPVLWQPSGNADSTLAIKLTAERAFSYTTFTGSRAAIAGNVSNAVSGTAIPASGGSPAWTAPATSTAGTPGTYFSVKIHLFSRQIGPRSSNV